MFLMTLYSIPFIMHCIHSQAPPGYTFIAQNDYVDAGPGTQFLLGQNSTLESCADACDADPLCQTMSIIEPSLCALYPLRRCQTPAVHEPRPTISTGVLYEKNADVLINADYRITTICGK